MTFVINYLKMALVCAVSGTSGTLTSTAASIANGALTKLSSTVATVSKSLTSIMVAHPLKSAAVIASVATGIGSATTMLTLIGGSSVFVTIPLLEAYVAYILVGNNILFVIDVVPNLIMQKIMG